MDVQDVSTVPGQNASDRRYAVADPGLERGFIAVPKSVALDPSLSPAARITYAVLLEFAWREGHPEVAEPEVDDIAAILGPNVKRSTVAKYIRELSAAGLVESIRRGQGKPNRYLIAVGTDGLLARKGPSRSPVSGQPTRARKRSADELPDGPRTTSSALASQNGDTPARPRNVAFDALVEACDAAPDGRSTGVALAKIRKAMHDLGGDGEPASDDEVIDAIRTRAEMYRRSMGDALLTPSALAKWWDQLPRLAEQKRSSARRGLSPDEILAMGKRGEL